MCDVRLAIAGDPCDVNTPSASPVVGSALIPAPIKVGLNLELKERYAAATLSLGHLEPLTLLPRRLP